MGKEKKPIIIETADIYLHFPYIMEEEVDDLADFLEEEHIEYEGATDIFIDLQNQVKKQKGVINKAIEYLTSYSSIHTIQFGTENDSLNDIELNKTLDEKTLNEMTNRYLKVHDKLLEILKEVSE